MALFEGPEAVEDEGFVGGFFGTKVFVKEQAVATEAIHLALDGAVGEAELAADLAQAGAAHQSMEERFEEVVSFQPVVGGEGL